MLVSEENEGKISISSEKRSPTESTLPICVCYSEFGAKCLILVALCIRYFLSRSHKWSEKKNQRLLHKPRLPLDFL